MFAYVYVSMDQPLPFPVDIRRRFNVYKTSIRRQRRQWRRIDVLQTLEQRRVSTGLVRT